jgi:hypothetical protein
MLHFLLNLLNGSGSPVPEAGTTASEGSKSCFSGQLHLYTVDLAVGDVVLCAYGRGRVVRVCSDTQRVAVCLSSWRLSGRSKVTCYLASHEVVVVRLKKISEMSVHEMVMFVQELKEKAAREFATKDYAAALLTSTRAIDAAQYVNRKSGSSSSILQLNAVTLTVACSIRAAACCRQLNQSHEAATIAQDALVIIGNTLEAPKLDGSIRTHVKNKRDHGYNRVFGEWRVKNLLVLARVSIEQQDYEQALQVLDNARAVSTTYATSDCTRTPPLKSSRRGSLSSDDDPDDKRISVTMCEVLCESERKEEELSGSPWVDIGDDDGEDDVRPVSLGTSDAIKRIADLLVRETARKRNRREKLVHNMFGSSSPRTPENETEKAIPQERESVVHITPLSLPQEISTERQREDELSRSSVDSSLCVNINSGKDKDFDTPGLSLETKSAVDEIAASLLRPNPQEGTNDEEKKNDFGTQPPSLEVGSTVRATSPPLPRKSSDEAHQCHNMLDSSPRVIEDEERVREEADSQLLSLVVDSDIEATPPLLRGDSSLERKKFEQRVHDILGVSPRRVAVDDGQKEEDFDRQVSAPFLRREVSPERQAKEQWGISIPVASPMVTKHEATKEEFVRQLLSVVKESVADVAPPPLLQEDRTDRTEREKEEQPVNNMPCAWSQLKAE